MDEPEATITTVMVFVLAAAAGVFFLMADQAIRQIVFCARHRQLN
jgi:preprotein translocase subunit SecE